MLIAQDTGTSRFIVKAYELGQLKINEQWYTQPLLLSPQQLNIDHLSPTFEQLNDGDLNALLDTQAEICLLGTGAKQQFPAMSLLKTAYQRGKTIEVMDTRAAVHTFIVLAAEGRSVAALLFP